MKIDFAQYSHSTIGFPEVKLKWHAENGTWLRPYITVKGIISDLGWAWHNQHAAPFAADEMGRFDSWVRKNYADDSTVQG